MRFTVNGVHYSKSVALAQTPENLATAVTMREQFIAAAKFVPTSITYAHAEILPSHYSRLFLEARKRAALKGIEYTLSRDDAEEIIMRAGGCCEVTGIVFSTTKHAHHFRAPFAPSLDRIDSAAGYTISNCRMICAAVNLAMNEWGEEVFRTIAYKYIFQRKVPG